MKKLSYAFIFIILLYYIGFTYGYQKSVNAENQIIEIFVDGDSKPQSTKIGELEAKNNKIELWHHSDKYWSYKGIQISDGIFGDDLGNEELLEKEINEEITFEIPLEQNL